VYAGDSGLGDEYTPKEVVGPSPGPADETARLQARRDASIVFPTRRAPFFDYEKWGVVGALWSRLKSGGLQPYFMDSPDAESPYCQDKHLAERVRRHW